MLVFTVKTQHLDPKRIEPMSQLQMYKRASLSWMQTLIFCNILDLVHIGSCQLLPQNQSFFAKNTLRNSISDTFRNFLGILPRNITYLERKTTPIFSAVSDLLPHGRAQAYTVLYVGLWLYNRGWGARHKPSLSPKGDWSEITWGIWTSSFCSGDTALTCPSDQTSVGRWILPLSPFSWPSALLWCPSYRILPDGVQSSEIQSTGLRVRWFQVRFPCWDLSHWLWPWWFFLSLWSLISSSVK